MNTTPICFTEPPRLVELKREFRQLDQREQDLKDEARTATGAETIVLATALDGIRKRKQAIAGECFQLGLADGDRLKSII